MSALAGLAVVEFAQGVAGPHCGHLFAEHGATVTKIEPPKGEWQRFFGPMRDGFTPFFLALNAGKRGVALDLKSAAGKRAAQELARRADVMIDNSRPGVMDRLGLGHAEMRAANPKLIYIAVSGFGQHGPYRDRPAYDPVIQSMAGFIAANKDQAGRPNLCLIPVIDAITGVYAFQAALAALIERGRSGQGKLIDVSLMGSALAIQSIKSMETALVGKIVPTTPVVPTGMFATADGFVTIAAGTDPQFVDFCAALDRRDLLVDPRFAKGAERARHRGEIDAIIAAALGAQPTAHWMRRFAEHDVSAEPVNDYAAVRADPHVREVGLYRDLAQPGFDALPLPVTPGLAPSPPSGPCPRVGQHSRAVLDELGWSAADIDAAIAAGHVVG